MEVRVSRRDRRHPLSGRPVWLLMILTLGAGTALADWSQFLGAARDGRAEGALAESWPETGPAELWAIDVGPGFGGASVRDGEVFLFDRQEDARDVLRVFDMATGQEKWRIVNEFPGRLPYNGSRSVPTVTEDRIYALGPFGHVYCVDRESQALVWTVDLRERFDGRVPRWGYAASPLLYEDTVIVPSMGPEVGLVALALEDGATRWQSGEVGGDSYCSPAIYTFGERDVVLYISPIGLFGVDAGSGEIVLTWDGYSCRIPIPAPAPVGESRFFITGGYNAGSVMVEITPDGDKLALKELFRVARIGAQIQQPVVHEGHVYANFQGRRRQQVGMICYALDGERKWATEGSPEFGMGNVILVGDKLLCLGGDDGVLRMLEPTPDGYTELARAQVFEGRERAGEQMWAPMAFSDGKLLVRSQSVLKCLELGAARWD